MAVSRDSKLVTSMVKLLEMALQAILVLAGMYVMTPAPQPQPVMPVVDLQPIKLQILEVAGELRAELRAGLREHDYRLAALERSRQP